MLALKQLHKVYPKSNGEPLVAVNDLTLTFETQGIVGLLGSNGAGKTTTIKMICGLIQPTSGQVSLGGYDLHKQRGHALAQVGVVLEGARNVYWRMSAWQNLLYFGRLKGVRGRQLKQRASTLLDQMNLSERQDDDLREFSRGMQQKVAIAAALMADPPILLLDEPTLGLDVEAARMIKNLLVELAAHKLIILTTHQLDLAQSISAEIAIIRRGQLITHQPTEALLSSFAETRYDITANGDPHQADADCFPGGLTLHHDENRHITLSGPVADQAALYAALGQIHRLGWDLINVQQRQPSLEDVFIQLMQPLDTPPGAPDDA